MDCIIPEAPSCLIKEDRGSQTLQKIAKHLELYKPQRVVLDGEDDQENSEQNVGVGGSTCVISKSCINIEEVSCTKWREKRAAVLICLFEGPEGELRVILTKRSMKLSSYPGDVALPGGKTEERDVDDSATALREAMEEIGLASSLVQIVANLEPFLSQHLLKVIPVIGLIDHVEDFNPVLNADEVDAMFDVPLEMFLKKNNHRFEEREWMGWKYVVHIFDFETEKENFHIGGLTASILIQTASVIYQQSPSFEEHQLPGFQQLQKSLLLISNN
ncbi:hypothetical protein UlMin_000944 [Ulmus minor]